MENLIDERFCKCYGKHRLELSCAQCHRKVNIFEKDMRIQELQSAIRELICLKDNITYKLIEMNDIIKSIVEI
jgi:hypothetical protein